ncbi:hypothetical protein SAMN05444008_11452 [Cnuella takakiae]|uniref:Uncharacterized protein n=1 Tax=Cnuella takakiae TaxID=1302690 RepID=A0A1M5FKR5_9BACT|nr:hypothetical protein [Cnuella takakiae]OLY93729.1 hypothetical protein BUE76_18950 [Cnuella takakiae]SHF92120.1 hypothetical protein SAMN05444008_11452 [Cnuella takakiae]
MESEYFKAGIPPFLPAQISFVHTSILNEKGKGLVGAKNNAAILGIAAFTKFKQVLLSWA